MTAYLGLGSNVGEREANLQAALNFLDLRCGEVLRVSSVFETAPMYVEEQGAFLNACAALKTTLQPLELMKRIKEVEVEVGRIPRERYGPREIDIDLLAMFDDEGKEVMLHGQELTLPHPMMNERRFVLEPLRQISDRFSDPSTVASQNAVLRPDIVLSIHKD